MGTAFGDKVQGRRVAPVERAEDIVGFCQADGTNQSRVLHIYSPGDRGLRIPRKPVPTDPIAFDLCSERRTQPAYSAQSEAARKQSHSCAQSAGG